LKRDEGKAKGEGPAESGGAVVPELSAAAAVASCLRITAVLSHAQHDKI